MQWTTNLSFSTLHYINSAKHRWSVGKPRKLKANKPEETRPPCLQRWQHGELGLVTTSVSVGNWSKKGGTEKIWHQHSYFQSFSLPSSLRTISNQLCVKPNVNRVQSVQHHLRDSVLVGGRYEPYVPAKTCFVFRSAANPAQLEPPLPIDAPTTLKRDIPACQKHLAGSI